MKRTLTTVVLGAVLVIVTSATVRHFFLTKLEDAAQAVVAANAEADVERARVNGVLAALDSVAGQRDSSVAKAQADAVSAARREAALRARLAERPATTADTDSALAIIDDLQAVNAELAEAVTDGIRIENDLRSTITGQQRTIARLQNASTRLVDATKEPLLSKLLPKSGPGITAGCSPLTQRCDIIIGYTLYW